MFHNAEYVIVAYSLSLGLIAIYAVGLLLRHKQILRQSAQLQSQTPQQ